MATEADAALMLRRQLIDGITRPDRSGRPVRYRFVRLTDDVAAMTDLLHRAYAPLAAAGMHYVASHQSADVTVQRMAKGDTVVAVITDHVIGTVTLARASETSGSPFYDRIDVAHFGQFAVDPEHQRSGIGSTLLTLVETLAEERGVRELGLDTSEHASGLIRLYSAKGYRFVEFSRWSTVNYRSVIMAKTIGTSPE